MPVDVPDACTLPTAERPLREREFEKLCLDALDRHERVSAGHLRLSFVGDRRLDETVRDLAARENECCSFFDFTVTPTAGTVVLDVKVPAAHIAVLDGLNALADVAALSR